MPATKKQQTKLVRMISACADMHRSIEAADLILAGVSAEVYPHLFLSMVVAYGRPFFENEGVGPIRCDYPDYPDFDDPDMCVRHHRLIDLRNKFLAHSSAEGTRVFIVPPNVRNPVDRTSQRHFDFMIGKRMFGEPALVPWLRAVPVAFKERLHADIRNLLSEVFGRDQGLDQIFELPTGHENFRWT